MALYTEMEIRYDGTIDKGVYIYGRLYYPGIPQKIQALPADIEPILQVAEANDDIWVLKPEYPDRPNVNPPATVTAVTLDTTSLDLEVDGSAGTVQAKLTLQEESGTKPSVKWSIESGDSFVSIAETGVSGDYDSAITVTPIAEGSATITCVAGGVSPTTKCTVTVTEASEPVETQSVAVSPKATSKKKSEIISGDNEVTLTATVTPEGASPAVFSVESDDDSVIASSQSTGTNTYKVTLSGNSGAATVRATSGAESDTATITVTNPVTAITINPDDFTLDVGASDVTLSVTGTPGDADAFEVTYTSQNTDIATIVSGNQVHAVKAGTATVKAAVNGMTPEVSDTITVTVQQPVTAITVTSTSDTVEAGKTLQMAASVSPEDATDSSVSWSVTPGTGTATITQAGVLTAQTEGTVTVVATAEDDSGVTGSKVITITPAVVLVTGITVSGDGTAVLGETKTYSVSVSPEGATNKAVTWSVTPGTGTATITQAGVLTPGTVGTVTVVATAQDGSDVTGEKSVTIGYAAVENVTLNHSTISIVEQDTSAGTDALTATLSPEGDVDPQTQIAWSVEAGNEEYLTISGNGATCTLNPLKNKATAINVTATAGGKSATCAVTVTDAPVESVVINGGAESVSVEKGKKVTLTATKTPDYSDVAVSWSVTAGSEYASIAQTGEVTGVAVGTATVTATAGGKSDTITVNVTQPATTAVTIQNAGADAPTLSLATGGSATLTAVKTPSDGTGTVIWSVENDTPSGCVTVENGVVQGVAAGTATVKAAVGAVSDTCAVTVADVALESIVAPETGTQISAVVGVKQTLTVGFDPENATNKSVTWAVSTAEPAGCVTVDPASGEITPSVAGTATITATASQATQQKNIVFTVTITEAEAAQASVATSKARASRKKSV